MRRQGITYFTLGDPDDDPRFYDRLLEIAADGSWRLRPPVSDDDREPPAANPGRRRTDVPKRSDSERS